MKNILKAFFIITISSIIGLFLLMIAQIIPSEYLYSNADISTNFLAAEGLYPEKINFNVSTRMDNWTDSLIINNAMFDSGEGLLNKALMTYRFDKGDTPLENIIYYFWDDSNGKIVSYERYWHGYLVIIKPLLALMNLSQIRILSAFCIFILLYFLLYLLAKKINFYTSFAFLIAFLSIMGFVIPFSLQYSTIMIIILSSNIIYLLSRNFINKNHLNWLYFLLLGIITVYFDYLTYPIATLTTSLIICQLLDKNNSYKCLFNNVFYWCLGYGGMWLMKWAMVSIFTDINIFLQVLSVIKFRTSSVENYNRLQVIKQNIDLFKNKITILTITSTVIGSIVYRLINKYFFHVDYKTLISLSIIFSIPFIWCLLMANHSMMHFYFTYRMFLPSIWLILLVPQFILIKK